MRCASASCRRMARPDGVAYPHFALVVPAVRAGHRAPRFEAIDQLHRAVMLEKQPRGNLPDSRLHIFRKPVYRQQQLMLLRLDAMLAGGGFAERKELAARRRNSARSRYCAAESSRTLAAQRQDASNEPIWDTGHRRPWGIRRRGGRGQCHAARRLRCARANRGRHALRGRGNEVARCRLRHFNIMAIARTFASASSLGRYVPIRARIAGRARR